MPKRIEINNGDVFGSLTVISEVEPYVWGKYKHRMVKCSCSCGMEKTTRLEYLRSGHTKSCGCHRKTISAKANISHGLTGTRIYRIWSNMKSRCVNKHNKSYCDYGGRGISFCPGWSYFESFLLWAKKNGYSDNLTIERIDNDGDYNPGNCTWIPKNKQAENTRKSIPVIIEGIEFPTISAAARSYKYIPNTVFSRLARGQSIEDALGINQNDL